MSDEHVPDEPRKPRSRRALLKVEGTPVTLPARPHEDHANASTPGERPKSPPTPAPSEPRRRTREEFLDYTIALWTRRTGRQIDREEALRMIENVGGYFRLLDEFDRALEKNTITPDHGDH